MRRTSSSLRARSLSFATLLLLTCATPSTAKAQEVCFQEVVPGLGGGVFGGQGIAAVDLNLDGALDLLASEGGANQTIWIAFGDGNGGFDNILGLSTDMDVKYFASADLNGDGLPDLVASGGNRFDIYFASSPGVFLPPTSPTQSSGWHKGVVTLDWDQDGDVDIAVNNEAEVRLDLFENTDGLGSFALADHEPISGGATPWGLKSADINGDGWADLVGASHNDGDAHVYLNPSTGSCELPSEATYEALEQCGQELSLADINGDGHIDILISAYWDVVGLPILYGDGSGGFSYGQTLDPDRNAACVTVGDMNGDGANDIVYGPGPGDHLGHEVRISLGPSYTTTVVTNISLDGSGDPRIAAHDLNQDGIDDLIVNNPYPTAYLSGSDCSLVFHYRLDGDGEDSGPNNLDGTPSHPGDPSPAEDRHGDPTGACSFAGGVFHVADDDVLTLGKDDFTLSLWVYWDDWSQDANFGSYLIGHNDNSGSHPKWILIANSDELRFHTWGHVNGTLTQHNPVAYNQVWTELGEWHHVAVVRNSNNFELFIDGHVVDAGSSEVDIPNISAALVIANAGADSSPFYGRLDDLALFGRALSDYEIQTLAEVDCNNNGILDLDDISSGLSHDCDLNGVPDECQGEDCDGDGISDICQGKLDCDLNGIPDSCDILADPALDLNGDGRLDDCHINIQADWVQSPMNGNWYGVDHQFNGWAASESLASRLGGHLATIREQIEQQWIEDTFPEYSADTNGLWIGLNDTELEGSFEWTSGAPFTFGSDLGAYPWHPGDPSNTNCGGCVDGEDCVYLLPGDLGLWGDFPDTHPTISLRGLIELPANPHVGWSWPQSYPAGGSGYRLALPLDVDNDGDLDVAMSLDNNSLVIHWNDGQGNMTQGPSVSFGGNDWGSIAGIDHDQDGDMDILMPIYWDQRVLLFENDGAGGFAAPSEVVTGGKFLGIDVADIDGDGFDDAVVTDAHSHGVRFLLGLRGGGFDTSNFFSVGTHPWYVYALDLDNDSDQDLIVSSNGIDGNGAVYSLINSDGQGGDWVLEFEHSTNEPRGLGHADLNGDGYQDLVIPHASGGPSSGTADVRVYLSQGNGSFSEPISTPLGEGGNEVVLEDFDNDGELEALVLSESQVRVFEFDPSGTSLVDGFTLSTGAHYHLSADDLNGDQKVDILLNPEGVDEMRVSISNWGALDCNGNDIPDAGDIASGYSPDCNLNGIPDECELDGSDCDGNGEIDECEISGGYASDCDSNGVIDSCEFEDCNDNNIHDPCDLLSGYFTDVNDNGTLDICERVEVGSFELIVVEDLWPIEADFDLLSNLGDFDIDYVLQSSPGTGTVSVSGASNDPSFAYDGEGGWQFLAEGEETLDSFSYMGSPSLGGDAASDIATVTLRLTGTNDAPIGANGSLELDEDSVTMGAFIALDFDSDDDGGSLSYEITKQPDSGTAWVERGGPGYSFDARGAFEELPAGGSQAVQFDWTAADRHGADTGLNTIHVSVTGVNDSPVTSPSSESTDEDTSISGTLPGDDVDNGEASALVYQITGNTAGGEASTNGANSFDFDPLGDFQHLAAGASVIESFQFTATDPQGAVSNESEVVISIAGVNDAPTASDSTESTDEDTSLVGALLGGDVDDGEAPALTYEITGDTVGGAATTNGSSSFDFDPLGDFQHLAVGASAVESFLFTATDPHGAVSNEGEVAITITGVNDTPTSSDSAESTDEDSVVAGALVADDVDQGEAAELSYVITSQPSAGALIHNAGESVYSFDPAGAFDQLSVGESLADSFTFTAEDPHGAVSNESEVTISVSGVNDCPVSSDSSASTDEDTLVTGTMNADDLDGDDSPESLWYAVTQPPQIGSLVVDGSSSYQYDPAGLFDHLADGETATVSFKFIATDAHSCASNESEVTITINGVTCEPADYFCGDVVAGTSASPDGARIQFHGTPSYSQNEMSLSVSGLPSNRPGLFIMSPGLQTPPVSFGDGFRCIGLFGLKRIYPAVFSDANGNVYKDLSVNHPAFVDVQVGDRRYFELWFRDPNPGFAGFNLSDVAGVTFCP